MSSVSLSEGAVLGSSSLPPPFTCSWKRDGFGSAWVHLTGELDLASVARFEATVKEAQLSVVTVSIDLQELSCVDCAGIKAILDANAFARREGNRLILVRGYGQVDRVLKLTGVLDQVEMVDLHLPSTSSRERSRLVAATQATHRAGGVG